MQEVIAAVFCFGVKDTTVRASLSRNRCDILFELDRDDAELAVGVE